MALYSDTLGFVVQINVAGSTLANPNGGLRPEVHSALSIDDLRSQATRRFNARQIFVLALFLEWQLFMSSAAGPASTAKGTSRSRVAGAEADPGDIRTCR